MKLNNNLNPLKNFKDDIPASLVVFLVAMPLCLGIALASGAPMFAGLISGIIGGIVVGALSGSPLGVSGPAAGLTVVVLNAITDLGAFDIFLVAVVLAGIIQLILGFAKAGFIAYFFPSSVIHGMLAGIGILIFIKEIPHVFGYDKDPEGDFEFIQKDGENTLSELGNMLNYVSPGVIIVAFASLGVILLWETKMIKKFKFTKLIQGPLVAVVIGIVLTKLFSSNPELAISKVHLVNVPVPETASAFFSNFTFPDFSALSNSKVYVTAIVIAVVASLETLLCVEASDKLDPLKRITPTNRELKAQGFGNMLSGLVGGLPITQVIVRSSTNLQSGGKTKASTIMHGFLILFSIVLIPNILNWIPLGTLAAILLVVGYKLAKPALFKKMYQKGIESFSAFLVTVIAIIFTDLLIGIGLGLCVAIFMILKNNFKIPFQYTRESLKNSDTITIDLSEDVTFLNKASVQEVLSEIPENVSVVIDGKNSKFIDVDVVEIIDDFLISAPLRGIHATAVGLKNKKLLLPPQHFELKKSYMKTHTKVTQENCTPAMALQILKEGNWRFMQNLKAQRDLKMQVNETKKGQYPFAAVLGCIDSRVPAELVFDQGIGDIFCVRVAGNIINEDVLGSLEFACKLAGSKIIVVMGHTKCGAVSAACQGAELGNITGLLKKIHPAVEYVKQNYQLEGDEFIEQVEEKNICYSVDQIMAKSPLLKEMVENGEIQIIAAVYNVATGEVNFDIHD